MPGNVDYTAMSVPHLHAACAADGSKWAAAYCQHVERREGVKLDAGQALMFFCNAMAAMHNHLRPDAMPVILADGSAFLLPIGGNA